jgi:Ca2+-binding EF-hand superfamily protein
MFRQMIVFASLAIFWTIIPNGLVPTDAEAQGRGRGRGQARMRFEAMDTNRDGAISRNEWQGSLRSFQVHDWNGDGQLSGQEVVIGAQRNANWEEADHNPNRLETYVSWTQAGFNNLDHNRDRRITSNEWHHDLETFRRVDRNRDGALDQAEFIGADWDDDRGDSFDDLDFNNNGRVERSEWHGSVEAFNALDRNRDGVLSRFEGVGGQDTTGDTWDQFAGLDYNRNQSITRDEWHWSRAAFDQRDLNRDGMLSRREFEVAGGAPGEGGASAARSQTVRVNSLNRWTDAGIDVRAGDTLTINASGSIRMSDNDNGQDTATPAGSTTGRRAADAPILNQPAGALLARIDNYGPIFVGGQRSFRAPVSGRLYFGVNDDHLPDNRGEFVVNVSVDGAGR